MKKSRLLMSLLVIALAVGLIGGATMAWFTDTDNAGTATFTAGTLNVDVNDGLTTFHNLVPADKHGNMNPGDLYEPIVINITNTGTKNLIWFGNWSATLANSVGPVLNDKLLDGIYINSAKMEFLAPATGAWSEPTDIFITNGVGSGAYPGWFNGLAAQGPFPVVSLREWNDNNGMGTTPYEHVGALKPGYSYRLTVQFGFYSGVDNTYQGDVASPIDVGFTVNATQVKAAAIDALVTTGGGGAYWETWGLGQIGNQL